jgi:PPOX class probable F420-dependent enzyme
LATVGEGDRPHLVPICFVVVDGALYTAVDEKPKRSRQLKRLENIRSRPAVSVLIDHYAEDWSELWWARLDGRAEVLEEGPEVERALAVLAEKYPQYRERPPGGPVVAVRELAWRWWAAR